MSRARVHASAEVRQEEVGTSTSASTSDGEAFAKGQVRGLGERVRALAQGERTWEEAQRLVLRLEKERPEAVDAWMYTELLRSFRKRGRADEAYCLYQRVKRVRPALRLTSHFYAEAMLALSKGSREEAAKARGIWEDLLRATNGEEKPAILSKYALTGFLCAMATAGDWQRALRAFHSDFFLFQSGSGRGGRGGGGGAAEGGSARNGGGGGRRKRRVPDVVACTALMKALRSGRQWQKGEQLLQWMYDNGIQPNAYTYAELISMLGECRQWERAMEHYSEILQSSQAPELNLHIFSATLNALGQAGQFDRAWEVLVDMVESQGVRPNAMFTVSLLSVYEKKHEGERALTLFRYIQSKTGNATTNIFVYNVLLSALSKSEAVAQCREVFEEAEAARGITPDRVTYETLIQAYAHVGDFGEADAIFSRMLEKGFTPTDYAYAARIKAYAKNHLWREAVAILREVEESGHLQPSVHVYNATLYACQIARKWELALKLFERMESKGIAPNDVTKALLARICHEGIESFEDKQRQAATISAALAAAGALAIRTGIF